MYLRQFYLLKDFSGNAKIIQRAAEAVSLVWRWAWWERTNVSWRRTGVLTEHGVYGHACVRRGKRNRENWQTVKWQPALLIVMTIKLDSSRQGFDHPIAHSSLHRTRIGVSQGNDQWRQGRKERVRAKGRRKLETSKNASKQGGKKPV